MAHRWGHAHRCAEQETGTEALNERIWLKYRGYWNGTVLRKNLGHAVQRPVVIEITSDGDGGGVVALMFPGSEPIQRLLRGAARPCAPLRRR